MAVPFPMHLLTLSQISYINVHPRTTKETSSPTTSMPQRYGFLDALRDGSRPSTFFGALFFHICVNDGFASCKLLHVQLRLFFGIGAAEAFAGVLCLLKNIRCLWVIVSVFGGSGEGQWFLSLSYLRKRKITETRLDYCGRVSCNY